MASGGTARDKFDAAVKVIHSLPKNGNILTILNTRYMYKNIRKLIKIKN